MDLLNILNEYFGFDNFRKGQKEIIDGILNKRDSLGIMPTSGGKSLCYQIPALINKGVTLVISPLISLMKDQVDALRELGISATYINSTQSFKEQRDKLKSIKEGKYKLIYVAPERLNSNDFLNLCKDIDISLVSIDEAHCISQWGHDFRPSYKDIPKFIKALNKKPVIGAFTATATKEVKKDIINILDLNNPLEVITGFNRPNLYFHVEKQIDKKKFLINYLNKHKDESGIIYCSTRKEVNKVANFIKENGYSVGIYHGGLESVERKNMQEKFSYDKKHIMVATNAFGMGIDKSNVRFVIHYNLPKNIESYYQEAGRAGRDGEKSDCILLFSPQDTVKQKYIIEQNNMDIKREKITYEKLQAIVDYCHTKDCLRKVLLEYFNDSLDGNCNNCSNCLDNRNLKDITIKAQKILSCVYRMKGKFGTTLVALVLNGSKNKKVLNFKLNKLSTYGIMDDTEKNIKQMIYFLIAEGYLELTNSKYPVVRLTEKSADILKGKEKIYMKESISNDKNKSDIINEKLLNKLKKLRMNLALKRKVPPYIIFSDKSLKEMCYYLPIEKKDMLRINGVGNKKFENYGEDFLKLIKEYKEKTNSKSIKKNINTDEKIKTHMKSYILYKQGKNLKEIANERDLTEQTVFKHICKCAEEGKDIKWDKMVDKEKEKQILQVIEDVGATYLKPIKESLPESFTYLDIKKVLFKRNYS
ncbi:MAG: DNA helicase RecQ [Firmicutes bacterium]|nr:DNA helicase RecQ [Bacillota bacterium]